ncbi:MAG: histidine kinase dimerization/phosphoacceptor domain -containing protein [Alsobacter sp.]
MPNRTLRVLYIDDDVAIGRLVQRILTRRGYAVECLSTAQEGLARIDGEDIDVVVLDHDLGVASGLDVLSALRDRPGAPPVVYVTASAELSIAVAALKAGAVDYVVKTVGDDFEVLLVAAIEQSLEKARLRRQKELAEREVREARDKAVLLLAEVNHRVANSLALAISLVRMQAAALQDSEAKAALAETQNRIAAIAKLHRSLYTSEDVRSVNLAAYLEGLAGELADTLTADGRTPALRLDLSPVQVPTDKAVSIGMVATELVTNAVKYAYPPETTGDVRLILRARDDGGFVLRVEDDGVGYGVAEPGQGSGLGSKIVGSLVRALKSDLRYERGSPGTQIVLEVEGEAAKA